MNPKHEIEIVGRHLELTEALKNKVNEMSEKLYSHDSGITRFVVELELERHSKTHHDEFIAKGRIDDRRDHFNVTVTGDDLYKAIGELGEKLDRLIRNRNRRRVTYRRRAKAAQLDAAMLGS